MNNSNQLENQLGCLKPRGPSAIVKQNIFGGSASNQKDTFGNLGETFALRWLAPAMACLVMTMLALTARENQFKGMTDGTQPLVMATFSPSNRVIEARLPIRFEMDTAALADARHVASQGSLALSEPASLVSLVTNHFRN